MKRNNQTNTLFVLAIICWTITTVRIWIFKKQQSKMVQTAPDAISSLNTEIEKQSLANLASIIGLNSIKLLYYSRVFNGYEIHSSFSMLFLRIDINIFWQILFGKWSQNLKVNSHFLTIKCQLCEHLLSEFISSNYNRINEHLAFCNCKKCS